MASAAGQSQIQLEDGEVPSDKRRTNLRLTSFFTASSRNKLPKRLMVLLHGKETTTTTRIASESELTPRARTLPLQPAKDRKVGLRLRVDEEKKRTV